MSHGPVTDSLGALIRRHRELHGWTQQQLAARLAEHGGIVADQSVIAGWESNRRRPSDRNRQALAAALGLHEMQLIEAARA